MAITIFIGGLESRLSSPEGMAGRCHSVTRGARHGGN
jgi:hypothetical protein